jgi:hypothetical protein
MREDDINLVQSQGPVKKNRKTFSSMAFGIFGVVFAIGAMLLIYSLYLSSNSTNLNLQIENIRGQISKNSEKKQKMLITSERLSAIKKLLAQRNGAEKSASLIYSVFSDNFSVESISADGSKITISVTSSSLSAFANLFTDTLPAFINKNKRLISSVHVETFSQSKGGYALNITFNTTEGEK